MKKSEPRPPAPAHSEKPFPKVRFEVGELYLFHPTDPACPPESSLWGVFDRRSDGAILLETSSCDLMTFARWHPLAERFRCCRLAARSELRDYIYNLGWADRPRTAPGTDDE